MRGKLIYNYIERVHEGKVEELIDLFNKVKVKAVGILLVVSLIFLMSGCVNQSAKGEIVAKVNDNKVVTLLNKSINSLFDSHTLTLKK